MPSLARNAWIVTMNLYTGTEVPKGASTQLWRPQCGADVVKKQSNEKKMAAIPSTVGLQSTLGSISPPTQVLVARRTMNRKCAEPSPFKQGLA